MWSKINVRPEEAFPNGTHIIGDKAHPCLQELQVPFKDNGHLTNAQRNYNFQLSKARSTIERAFGLLKKRFRCLLFLDVLCLEWIPKYIIACCVLHNICIQNGDILDINPLINNEDGDEDVANEAENLETVRLRLGQLKRNAICTEMMLN